MKYECPTHLRSKGKAMAITLNDDEVSDAESGSDEDGNFITFTATVVVNESASAEENRFDGELSEDADLQEANNKLCKVAAKDVMSEGKIWFCILYKTHSGNDIHGSISFMIDNMHYVFLRI